MTFPRHELPVYSPLDLKSLGGALIDSLVGEDPRSVLEGLLQHTYDADWVRLCASGTHALQLAIAEARRRISRPAPLALPAFNCFDVATAAVASDLPVVVYDIDPRTLAPDLESLERVLAAGAGIVVVANLYGFPIDWDEVGPLIRRYGAIDIEDAAQGHGASWDGRPAGGLGTLSVLSFGRGKGWSGIRGGALIGRGSAGPSQALRGTGPLGGAPPIIATAAAQWLFGRPALYSLPKALPFLGLGETRFHPPTSPRHMTRVAAGLVLRTRDAAACEATARRANGAFFADALADTPGLDLVASHPRAVPGYLRFPLRIRRPPAALPARWTRLGISPAYPRVLHHLPAIAERLAGPPAPTPGADDLAHRLITLPTHSKAGSDTRRHILSLISDAPSSVASLQQVR